MMMNRAIRYTVNGPSGSRAVLWAGAPAVVLKAPGIEWRDEFGRPLNEPPDLGKSPAVVRSPLCINQVMRVIGGG